MSDFVLALTTVPAGFDATALAQDLVGTGLAACVTILPGSRSVYIWKGVPHIDQEQQLILKTTSEQIDALWAMLSDRHPYDLPEFIVVPIVDGHDAYLKWIDQSVGARPES